MDIALQLASNVLIPGLLFALIAAGFSLIYSVTRIVHFAHGGTVIAAGYVFYAGITRGWHPLVAAAAAVLAATALGLIIHLAIYERLRTRASVSAAGALVATLSILLILQYGIQAAFGSDTKSFGALSGALHAFGPVILSDHEIRMMVICAVLLAALQLFLARSRAGTALRAVAEHETVAEVVGIPASRMRALAMGIGSALAGVAGVLFAIEYSLEPAMSSLVSVRMFFRSVLGGIGSVPGATIGSLLSEIVTALTGWYWSAAWVDFMVFILLFVVLLLRPNGLLGATRRSL